MKTLQSVGQAPIFSKVVPCTVCTPSAENSDAHEVALVGKDGQGVCALPGDVICSIEAFHLNHEAYECVAALYTQGLVPVRAVTLVQSALEERVGSVIRCGYLLYMH